jgi:hypothetical protein
VEAIEVALSSQVRLIDLVRITVDDRSPGTSSKRARRRLKISKTRLTDSKDSVQQHAS